MSNKWSPRFYFEKYGLICVIIIITVAFIIVANKATAHVDLIDPGLARENVEHERDAYGKEVEQFVREVERDFLGHDRSESPHPEAELGVQ